MSTVICRWLFILISLSAWVVQIRSKEIRVVCYYTNWSVYRPGAAKFSPQNINPYLCTHLIYAFGGFTKENNFKPFDKYQDIEKGGYAKFTGLKTYNKQLKTLIAIGGWNEGSSRFSTLAASPDRRRELVRNAIKFLRQNHFDGLDLDWEYPAFRDGGKPRDRDNYAKLVQELREEFDRESEKTGRPRLLLTMAVPAGIEYINKGYDIPKLNKYLDWMNILSYDYHSAFEPSVNHHAPLFSLEEDSEYNFDAELNIDFTIKHYLKLGASPDKLVLGIPTYGRSYTLFNPDANELGAPADGPGEMGDATRENGYLAYYEICAMVKNDGWEVVQPAPGSIGPYAFKDNQWVGYDDEAMARRKAEYVAKERLGGIMFWAIDNDDFRGSCHQRPYPIIEAAKESLIDALGLNNENFISPTKSSKSKSKSRHRSKASTTTTTVAPTNRRRSRPRKPKPAESSRVETTSQRAKPRRKQNNASRRSTTASPTTHSNLKIVTPSYTTPPPPSTPDQNGGGFKCEDEGFFPHPNDCKKYYWCLSGPGELGIIAHQFTCPAGLHFNKGADSCDYARNVHCNKKSASTTTTTTTEIPQTTTTTQRSTSARGPSRLDAILGKKSTTTTTEPYEDEYGDEYEDDYIDDDKDIDAEEDPKVIKELFELIKKAGGIEELEKQLNIHHSSSDTTTKSSLSKTLNKVLKGRQNLGGRKNSLTYTTLNRNSRGPQNEGLSRTEESSESEDTSSKSNSRSKPQYTSISRRRPTTEKSLDDDDDNDDEGADLEIEEKTENSKKYSTPKYVNIRRGNRLTTPSSAVEEENNDESNSDDRKKNGDEPLGDIQDIINSRRQSVRQTTPKYVNIRRQRPSTTESSDSEEEAIVEEVTVSSNNDNNGSTLKSYIIFSRGTSTQHTNSAKENETTITTTPKYKTIVRSTVVTVSSSQPDNDTDVTTESIRSTLIPKPDSTGQTHLPIFDSTEDSTPKTTPHLLEPRPFSLTTTTVDTADATETVTQTPKVSHNAKPALENVDLHATSTTPKPKSTRKPNKKISYRFKDLGSQSLSIDVDNSISDSSRKSARRRSHNLDASSNKIDDEPTTKATLRGRSKSRFTTTESYIDSYYDYEHRSYRPDQISDLSSLTALDIDGTKRSKRIRVRPTSSTTKSDADEDKESDENLRTGARTLTLPRRILKNTNTIGGSRRSFVQQEQTVKEVPDQLNSSSDILTSRRRQTVRNQTEISADEGEVVSVEKPRPRSRLTVRRFRPTTAAPVSRSSTSRVTINRQAFRRFRTTSPKSTTVNVTSTTESINESETSDNTTTNNTRESENKIGVVKPSEKEGDDEEDISAEDDEQIKLSESNIRENNDVSNDNTINDDSGKRKVIKRVRPKIYSKVENDKTTRVYTARPRTTPRPIVRTRKIVRKYTTEPTPKITTESTNNGTDTSTRRKVIRRFRPRPNLFGDTSTPTQTRSRQNTTYVSSNRNTSFRRRIPSRTRTTVINDVTISSSSTTEKIVEESTVTSSSNIENSTDLTTENNPTINQTYTDIINITTTTFTPTQFNTQTESATTEADTTGTTTSFTHEETDITESTIQTTTENELGTTGTRRIIEDTTPYPYIRAETTVSDINTRKIGRGRTRFQLSEKGEEEKTIKPSRRRPNKTGVTEESTKIGEENETTETGYSLVSEFPVSVTESITTQDAQDLETTLAIDEDISTINPETTSTIPETTSDSDLSTTAVLSTLTTEKEYSSSATTLLREETTQSAIRSPQNRRRIRYDRTKLSSTTEKPSTRTSNRRFRPGNSSRRNLNRSSLAPTVTSPVTSDFTTETPEISTEKEILTTTGETTKSTLGETISTFGIEISDETEIPDLLYQSTSQSTTEVEEENSTIETQTETASIITEKQTEVTNKEQYDVTSSSPSIEDTPKRRRILRPNLTPKSESIIKTDERRTRIRVGSLNKTKDAENAEIEVEENEDRNEETIENNLLERRRNRPAYVRPSRLNTTRNLENRNKYKSRNNINVEDNVEAKRDEISNELRPRFTPRGYRNRYTTERSTTTEEIVASDIVDENDEDVITTTTTTTTTIKESETETTPLLITLLTTTTTPTTTENIQQETTENLITTTESRIFEETTTDQIDTTESNNLDTTTTTQARTTKLEEDRTEYNYSNVSESNNTNTSSTINNENYTNKTSVAENNLTINSTKPSLNNTLKQTTRIRQRNKTYRPKNRFVERQKSITITNQNSTNNIKVVNASIRPLVSSKNPSLNRNLYKQRTRTKYTTKDENETTETEQKEIENVKTESKFKPKSRFKPRISNTPVSAKKSTTPSPSTSAGASASASASASTSASPTISTVEADEIDTQEIKNRNKKLFSKQRHMNVPHIQTAITAKEVEVSTEYSEGTTEYPTTLLHIFSEINTETEETTTNPPNTIVMHNSVERIVEVNRVVEVRAKAKKVYTSDGFKLENITQIIPTVDRLGAINRVTVINVVNNDNSTSEISNEINKTDDDQNITTVRTIFPVYSQEGTTESVTSSEEIARVTETTEEELKKLGVDMKSNLQRQDKKFEIYGNSKVFDYNKIDNGNVKAIAQAEIIDGRSHINIITPKPFLSTESATIPLQSLFKTETESTTETAKKISENSVRPDLEEDILQLEGSRYVNIRLLDQESGKASMSILDDTEILPIRVLPQDEEVTLKARVEEVTPKESEAIKIIPIQVEMARNV